MHPTTLTTLDAGLALLPQRMRSPAAKAMLLAIGLQESRFRHRVQIGSWGAGRSYGVFVAIDPEKRADRGLLEHELQHCRQFYRSLGLNALLYFLSKRHRYRQEVECYAVQLLYSENPTQDVRTFASYIHRHYGLGTYVTPTDARQRLSYEFYLRSTAVR